MLLHLFFNHLCSFIIVDSTSTHGPTRSLDPWPGQDEWKKDLPCRKTSKYRFAAAWISGKLEITGFLQFLSAGKLENKVFRSFYLRKTSKYKFSTIRSGGKLGNTCISLFISGENLFFQVCTTRPSFSLSFSHGWLHGLWVSSTWHCTSI